MPLLEQSKTVSDLRQIPEERSTGFPFVSVIVPIRNDASLITECLKSLLEQDYPQERMEIIVVDNNSTDHSVEAVRGFPVRCLRQESGKAGAARNRGAWEARGDLLAFTDADCVVPTDWISRLVDVLQQEPEAVLAGGEVIPQGGSLLQEFLAYQGMGFDPKVLSADSGHKMLPWILTGNVMVRRSMFQRVGGFEESFQPGEDIDLSWRMNLAGGYPRQLPDLKVLERRRYSLRHFYGKNFRTGLVADLLRRRFDSAWSQLEVAGPSPFKRLTRPVRRLGQHLEQLFVQESDRTLSKKLCFLFFLCSGHLFFQLGKGVARLRYDFLKEPFPTLPVSTREVALHPVIQAGFLEAEDRLLYLSCIPKGSPMDHSTRTRLLSQIEDWNRLLSKAVDHRLQPRLTSFLKRSGCSEVLDPDLWKRVEWVYHKAQAYTLALEAELAALLAAFHRSGVEVLLLKGAALIQTVYRERPLRYFVDLDLMVRREDFSRAQATLEHCGYRSHPARLPLPSRWHAEILQWRAQEVSFPFIHQGQGTHVDIHLDAFEFRSGFQLEPDWLWEGSQPILVAGAPALLPDPNRLFVHLLLHLAKHIKLGENFLGWYLDLDECLRYFGGRIDGPLCCNLLGENLRSLKVLEILAFLDFYFSSPLPKEFLSLIRERDLRPPSLERLLSPFKGTERMARRRSEQADHREFFLLHWRQVSGLRNKSLYLLKWIFPDSEYLRRKYRFGTSAEKLLAYVRHFATMMTKGASLGFDQLRRKRKTSDVKTKR